MAKVISMVHYQHPKDTKHYTNMDIVGNMWEDAECFTLKYEHHAFHNNGKDIEIGTKCVCGKERYSGEDYSS